LIFVSFFSFLRVFCELGSYLKEAQACEGGADLLDVIVCTITKEVKITTEWRGGFAAR
jgi:hypothetical protein